MQCLGQPSCVYLFYSQIEHDRQVVIQRHNAQLLGRMHTIMHTTGRVDHRNADWRPKRSVNFVKKKREMDKITRENQDLLKRLQTIQPQYSTRKWEADFQEHHTRARSMQLFPPVQVKRLSILYTVATVFDRFWASSEHTKNIWG